MTLAPSHSPTWASYRLTSIRHQLGALTRYLAAPDAPPHDIADTLARLLDTDKGLLVHVSALMATAASHAKAQAEHGALPAEVCLALGRAANDLDAVTADLHEHAAALKTHATSPPATNPAPTPAPLVVRRHR